MAKIPTYESRRVPSGNVSRPNLPDYSVQLAQKAVKYANNVLDKQAQEEGLQEGFEAVEQGTQTIEQAEQKSSLTIRGKAFKTGARNAFIAKTKTDLEKQLTELYADTEVNANSEMFNQKVSEIREGIVSNTPSSIAQVLLPEIDGVLGKYSNLVLANEIELEDANNTGIEIDRLSTVLIPRIESDLNKGLNVENDFAESLAILEDLYKRNKITTEDYLKNKNTLVGSLITPIFNNKYRAETDKAKFLEDLQNPDSGKMEEVMQEIYDVYGDEYEKVFGKGTFPINLDIASQEAIVSAISSSFSTESKLFKAELKQYKTSSTTRISTIVSNGGDLETELPFDQLMEGADKYMADEDYKQSLAYTWEKGKITSHYTKGIKNETMSGIDAKLKEIDNEIEITSKLTDVDSQVKLEALNDAKIAYQKKQVEIYEQVNKGNSYAVTSIAFENSGLFFNQDGTVRDVTTMSASELYARRELVANYLGIKNAESFSLFDQSEIDFMKADFTNANTPQELVNAVNNIKLMGQENNIDFMGKLDLDPEQEALFLLEGDANAQLFMAEALLLNEENKERIGDKANEIDDKALSYIKQKNITGSPFEENRIADIWSTLYAHGLAKGYNKDKASKVANEYIEKSFYFKTIELGSNEQNMAFPKTMNEEDIDNTIGYIQEVFANPVRYGLDIPLNVSADEINFSDMVMLERNGDFLVPTQRIEFAGGNSLTEAFSGFRIQHPSETDNAAVELLRIAVHPNDRVQPDQDAPSHWAFAIESTDEKSANKLVKKDLKVFGVTTGETVTEESYQNFVQHYFNIADEYGYKEKVDEFATNIAGNFADQKAITGIVVKNIANANSWTEDEFEYLSQFSSLDALKDENVRNYVMAEWDTILVGGGYATLRTGKKLSPLASLYALVEEAQEQLEG